MSDAYDEFYFSSSDENEEEECDVDMRVMSPRNLVEHIKSFGTIVGLGRFKGSIAIRVKAPSNQARFFHFNIGHMQGLRLLKKKTRSESTSDTDNLLDISEQSVQGVFHLLFQHSDAVYSVSDSKVHSSDWYEVDLFEVKTPCVTCGHKSPVKYIGPPVCLSFE